MILSLSPVLPTYSTIELTVCAQSSSPPDLPLVPCKEARHGRRTVADTVRLGNRRGQAAAAARAGALRGWGDPAGRALGGAARPAAELGVPGPELGRGRGVAVGVAALAGDAQPRRAGGGRGVAGAATHRRRVRAGRRPVRLEPGVRGAGGAGAAAAGSPQVPGRGTGARDWGTGRTPRSGCGRSHCWRRRRPATCRVPDRPRSRGTCTRCAGASSGGSATAGTSAAGSSRCRTGSTARAAS